MIHPDNNLFYQIITEINQVIEIESAYNHINPLMSLKIELYSLKKIKPTKIKNTLVDRYLTVLNKREESLNNSIITLIDEYCYLSLKHYQQKRSPQAVCDDLNIKISKQFNLINNNIKLHYLHNFLGSFLMWKQLKLELENLRTGIKKYKLNYLYNNKLIVNEK
ncbi:hypothetical protein [Spiroplasma sp. DGKH1]|uniref:hypothetical protein n=1 Tax=Spiroplasma sp. DGKH1 TaxID=3050074 RepID=UPI0034C69AD7